jgi:hypothetical protein
MNEGMNGGTGDSRGRQRRAGSWRAVLSRAGVLAAVAGTALLAAACGGGGSSAAGKPEAYQQALAYAKCMRSHGVPGWPDPTSQGTFDASQINQIPSSPQLQAAQGACARMQPPGNYLQVSAAQQQAVTSRALKIAACMRAHGIANFPDPDAQHLQSGQIAFSAAGIDRNSTQFQSAHQACEKLWSTGGGGS